MTSTDAEQVVLRTLQMLEHARKRPGMYLGPISFHAAENFFGGLGVGVGVATNWSHSGINAFRSDAKRARGYSLNATINPSEFESQVRSRFTADEQIVDELFQVEIDAWSRLGESLKPQHSSRTD